MLSMYDRPAESGWLAVSVGGRGGRQVSDITVQIVIGDNVNAICSVVTRCSRIQPSQDLNGRLSQSQLTGLL